MKKTITIFMLAIGCMPFLQAQINKNFATELKTIIKSDYKDFTGNLISEDKSIAAFPVRTYESKLPLTGFKTQVISSGVPIVYGKYNGKSSNAVMDDIAAKLQVFKNEYTILDSKTDKRLLPANSAPETRKLLLVDPAENVMAEIELEYFRNEYSIQVSVTKPAEKLAQVLPKSTVPMQIGDDFIQELKTLIDTKVETIKGAEYEKGSVMTYFSKLKMQGFDVKLKEVLDDYTLVCTAEGVSSKATMNAIFERLIELPYTRVDSKRKPEILEDGVFGKPDYRILLVTMDRKIKADITLMEKNKLKISIYKYDKEYTY